ncbi:uncharacterized protein V1516DRAFT_676340 [Lipomyces oligophaga]|uniref:uncharacterized protein n=1 Tax=Lipomyces oligophaga TaxID=45792 RepID=UPI0034D009CD
MCGRYSVAARLEQLRDMLQEDGIMIDEFAADDRFGEYYPSNNVRPTTFRPVMYRQSGDNQLHGRLMRWAFIPPWEHEIPRGRPPVFNARSDNLSSNMWTKAFHEGGRCIVPADGYYEWLTLERTKEMGLSSAIVAQVNKTGKLPYFVRPREHTTRLMYLAGLYTKTHLKSMNGDNRDQIVYSFAIVTTDAAPSLEFLHHRTPLILEPGTEAFKNWLDPDYKHIEHLPMKNDAKMVERQIEADKADIYLSGPKDGQKIIDDKSSITRFLGAKRLGENDISSSKRIKSEPDSDEAELIKTPIKKEPTNSPSRSKDRLSPLHSPKKKSGKSDSKSQKITSFFSPIKK